ncbi:MAG TPA: 50S ribosomal protein L9 [Halanaerobiaceae bacterium]|jgi:large subunit ribosomal protein L9|nr:50S ribosomal protein L9 [Bacillota bacterium]HHU91898.1 50S ribosomal protein L9 [Halanaerobiaceae bacterium]HOA40799.1 50S ribosomal protein L9 [Halanaerobiales bacterium]HPZ63005.1 50S ribosomal protein L9 [Halanaerobiales bacterium]HQD04186.1 50S ribosomal protein L9 [Halanaerobiales bacterium]
MKVILKEDVKKLGSRGDIVNVSDGYARNYLFPRGLAEEANKGNIQQQKDREKARLKRMKEEKAAAEEMASRMEKEKFVIPVKAGEQGRLFGSVTSKDIADAVEKAGYEIDRRKIQLDENIKSLGMHKVKVRLYEDVVADIKIQVVEA